MGSCFKVREVPDCHEDLSCGFRADARHRHQNVRLWDLCDEGAYFFFDNFPVVKLCQGISGGHGDTEFDIFRSRDDDGLILDGIQQSVDDFLGVSCFVLLRERDQACAPHSFDFCGATIFGQHVQHPPSVDILATKYAFEFGIGSDKGGADLVDQPGVGPGEVFIDTVEYF